MKRIVIWATCLTAATGMLCAQHGRGGGAGGGHAMPPQMSQPAGGKPAEAGPHGPAAQTRTGTMDVAARIAAKPGLSARLEPLLPAGANMQIAADGFRNQGQFIAALHVAKNLNIPFTDLKTAMTGEKPLSLGKAIQQLRPDLDKTAVNTEVKNAETAAKRDLRAK